MCPLLHFLQSLSDGRVKLYLHTRTHKLGIDLDKIHTHLIGLRGDEDVEAHANASSSIEALSMDRNFYTAYHGDENAKLDSNTFKKKKGSQCNRFSLTRVYSKATIKSMLGNENKKTEDFKRLSEGLEKACLAYRCMQDKNAAKDKKGVSVIISCGPTKY